MIKLFFSIILVFLQIHVIGQVINGEILDIENFEPIQKATVFNKQTNKIVISDSTGRFEIFARPSDTLIFTHTSYRLFIKIVTSGFNIEKETILLQPKVIKLKETTIIGLTKYQQDSVARHEMYNHELNKVIVPNPKFTGLGCSGCIGWIADKITGNSKKPKRFRKQFAKEDEQKYIDSKYTFDLITKLTGIRDTESLALFINTYPLEYSFARAATDLELKAWIRNNYKLYFEKDTLKKN